MSRKCKRGKILTAMLMAMIMMVIPVCAEDMVVKPKFNNISSAALQVGFDKDYTVYCTLTLSPYPHCSGVSGIMKLWDSHGNCLDVWSVSDYERPFMVENTYPGVYGETYTVTFGGHVYSNNGTAADRLDMSVTDTCVVVEN